MEVINNYTNTYLRTLLVGTKSYLNKKVEIEYLFESGSKLHQIPVYIALAGDNQYLIDAFVDDIPDKRVELNTDVKQKIVITPGTFKFKSNEFANPNVYLPHIVVEDEQYRKMMSKTKVVPLVWNMDLQIFGSSANEIFMIWEKTMEVFWLYKYFNVDYKRILIKSYIQFPDDSEMTIPRDFTFKDDTSLSIKFSVEVHSFFPIFDKENTFQYNKTVNWDVNLNGNELPV